MTISSKADALRSMLILCNYSLHKCTLAKEFDLMIWELLLPGYSPYREIL